MTKSMMCPAVTAGCSRCGKCPHLSTVTILAAGINLEILLVIFVPTTSSSCPQITRVGTAIYERWMQERTINEGRGRAGTGAGHSNERLSFESLLQ